MNLKLNILPGRACFLKKKPSTLSTLAVGEHVPLALGKADGDDAFIEGDGRGQLQQADVVVGDHIVLVSVGRCIGVRKGGLSFAHHWLASYIITYCLFILTSRGW